MIADKTVQIKDVKLVTLKNHSNVAHVLKDLYCLIKCVYMIMKFVKQDSFINPLIKLVKNVHKYVNNVKVVNVNYL